MTSPTEDAGRNYALEGNDLSGYIGVDAEYMQYANETEKPLLTDLEKWEFTDQLDHLEGNMDKEAEVTEDENEEKVEHNPPAGVPGATEPDENPPSQPVHNAPTSVPGVVITPTL